MALPKELTTVTPFSKLMAAILFIVLPFIGFLLGIRYQQRIELLERQLAEIATSNVKRHPTPPPESTADYKSEIAKICAKVFKTPTDPNVGITFEQSYCQGNQCIDAKTKNGCESKDVIIIESGQIASGKDGKPDCEWYSSVETMYFCKPLN